MSATFAKFHPSLIIGGTYSGQIVLWDNRSNKRTPVQRSPLSSVAHTVSAVRFCSLLQLNEGCVYFHNNTHCNLCSILCIVLKLLAPKMPII